MRERINKFDFALFLKTGIVVLTLILVVFGGVKHLPQAVTITSHSNSKKLPIYSVETSEKVVSLTFELNNKSEDLERILNVLDKYKGKGTFFVTGSFVDSDPEGLRQIVEAGHDIGNHSENHKHMDLLNSKECMEEIMNLHDKVNKITQVEMMFFRPPYGSFNNTIIHTAREAGYQTVKWDIDSQDWKNYSADNILKQTVENEKLANGSILLFHSGTKYTAQALEEVILSLYDQGYELRPLSKLVYTDNYTIKMSGRQYKK